MLVMMIISVIVMMGMIIKVSSLKEEGDRTIHLQPHRNHLVVDQYLPLLQSHLVVVLLHLLLQQSHPKVGRRRLLYLVVKVK